jgi:hypothetical protein
MATAGNDARESAGAMSLSSCERSRRQVVRDRAADVVDRQQGVIEQAATRPMTTRASPSHTQGHCHTTKEARASRPVSRPRRACTDGTTGIRCAQGTMEPSVPSTGARTRAANRSRQARTVSARGQHELYPYDRPRGYRPPDQRRRWKQRRRETRSKTAPAHRARRSRAASVSSPQTAGPTGSRPTVTVAIGCTQPRSRVLCEITPDYHVAIGMESPHAAARWCGDRRCETMAR